MAASNPISVVLQGVSVPGAEPPTFFGTSYHKVSPRNQASIPAHMLRVLQERPEGQLFLVRWREEPFLRLYTQRHMDRLIEKLRTDQEIPKEVRAEAEEALCSNAHPVATDGQGRVVLPGEWVAALGLQPEIGVVGRYHHIEIWPAARYRSRQTQTKTNLEAAEEKLQRVLGS